VKTRRREQTRFAYGPCSAKQRTRKDLVYVIGRQGFTQQLCLLCGSRNRDQPLLIRVESVLWEETDVHAYGTVSDRQRSVSWPINVAYTAPVRKLTMLTQRSVGPSRPHWPQVI
jgi:hypothetical protein